MENLSFSLILPIFFLAGAITWIAGVALTKTTDSLDTRFKLGEALGGLVLLGIAGSLPEIAIVFSAARHGHIPVIVGNLIGGIAIQTLIIVLFDFIIKKKKPLSFLAGSIILSLETLFAIFILFLTILAILIPAQRTIWHLNPLSIVIFVTWLGGLFLIDKARKIPHFYDSSPQAYPGRKHKERRATENHPFYAKKSTAHVIVIFLVACLATLIAGVLLEETGTAIATHLNIGSGIFAATAIALVASLPEISTGIESIFIGDNQLAISDILGGNAFMLVLFLLADIVAKKPVLSYAGRQDLSFALLGIFMMAVYAITFIYKLKRRYLRLGFDSILEILLYVGGVYFITKVL